MKKLAKVFASALAAIAVLPMSARADTYTYDQFGRLIQVVFTAGGTIQYIYDAAGNRTEIRKP